MQFSRLETCEFIAAQSAELGKLAMAADLPALSYLLEMARLEADNSAMAERRLSRPQDQEHRAAGAGKLVAFAP
jgi:hypothetical protein